MASILTHAIAAETLGVAVFGTKQPRIFWIVTAFLGMLPDADVLTFKFGVRYADMLGHRGFFHSFFWCLCVGWMVAVGYKYWTKQSIPLAGYALFFAAAMATHPLLDACTTGGLGVALFSPFDTTRYFFPWQVIAVSPIGIKQFFGEWGLRVLASECMWVWLPCAVIFIIARLSRTRTTNVGGV